MTYNPLVQLLRTYGPSAASDSQYDEHVRRVAAQFGVEEIRITAPLVETIGSILTGEIPTNVILTGTAGDGKTFHIRQAYIKHLGGDLSDWPGEDLVLSIPIQGDRQLRVIRDLSEFPDEKKDAEISKITQCLMGGDESTVYLIAANDGQLLDLWRVAMENSDDESDHGFVYRRLSLMLHEEREEDEKLDLRLFNLSQRKGHAETSVVDDVITALLEHPQWESGCEGCSLADNLDQCPIRINRRLLLGDEREDSKTFRRRLQDVVEIATANDQHIPLRQIIALIVNIVLGDHKDHDAPLLSCETARERAKDGAYRSTNPYDSAIGQNLVPETRSRYVVFSAMQALAVGAETTNYFDQLVLRDQPASMSERMDRIDDTYGRTIFVDIRARYLKSPRSRSKQKEFLPAMASQRRRLFFQLPEKMAGADSNWLLTVFHHGASYLAFKHALAVRSDLRSMDQRNAIDRSMFGIVRGFNRALTGLMTSDTSKLWLATTIGKSDDPSGTVATTPGIPRGSGMNLFYLRERFEPDRMVPCIEVASDQLGDFRPPKLNISPFLFEYLLRVSEGCLPTSFSSLCQQEVKHFAMVALEAIGRSMGPRSSSINELKILSLDSEAAINENAIKVMQA